MEPKFYRWADKICSDTDKICSDAHRDQEIIIKFMLDRAPSLSPSSLVLTLQMSNFSCGRTDEDKIVKI